MKTYDFNPMPISPYLKDPRSKALEPDCLSPHTLDSDTVSRGERERVRGGHLNLEFGDYLGFGFWDLEFCGSVDNEGRQGSEETSMA